VISFSTILEICKNAQNSIRKDADNEFVRKKWSKLEYIAIFYLIPLILGAIAFNLKIKLELIEGFIGTGIAIFTGLFFTLLVTVGDKIKRAKENSNMDNDNFRKFKNSLAQISNIILLSILLGILIFVLLLTNTFVISAEWHMASLIISSLSIYFLFQFLTTIILILQRFFYVVHDEIDGVL